MKRLIMVLAVLALGLFAVSASADIKGKIDDDGNQLALMYSPRKLKAKGSGIYGAYYYRQFDSIAGNGRLINTKPTRIIRKHAGIVVIFDKGADEAFGTNAKAVWNEISEKIPEDILKVISQIQFIRENDDLNYSWKTLRENPQAVPRANYIYMDHNSSRDVRLIYYSIGGYNFDEVAGDITKAYVKYRMPKKDQPGLIKEYRAIFNDDSKLIHVEDCLVKILRYKYRY